LRKIFFLFIFCLSFFQQPILLIPPQQISSILVKKNSAVVNFPRYINFNLTAQSDSEISQVVLAYGTNARTCLDGEARQELVFQPAKSVVLNWNWDLIRSSSFPPGVEMWWRWEIQDSAGNKIVTETGRLIIEDPNYSWQSLKNSSITLFWAEGDSSFGRLMMAQSLQSLDRLVKKAGLSQPDLIKIYVYPSAEEIKSATLHMPDWIGGLAYSEYDTTLIGVAPNNSSWASSIIPHELSHLVTGWRVFNCSGGEMPTWLSEGLARFAEGPTSAEDIADLKEAIQNGNVPGLQGLTAGFAASYEVSAFEYIYSGIVVTYLIEKFGADKMDALLGKIKEGNQIDAALRAIYEMDTVGLDKSWRSSAGLLPAAEVTSAPSTPTPLRTQIPTLSLWTPMASTPTISVTSLPTAMPTDTPDLAENTPISPTPTLYQSVTNAGETPVLAYAVGGILIIAIATCLVLFYLKRSS